MADGDETVLGEIILKEILPAENSAVIKYDVMFNSGLSTDPRIMAQYFMPHSQNCELKSFNVCVNEENGIPTSPKIFWNDMKSDHSSSRSSERAATRPSEVRVATVGLRDATNLRTENRA